MSSSLPLKKAAFTREALATIMMAASVAVTPPSTNRVKVSDEVMNRQRFMAVQMGNFSHYYYYH